MLTRQAEKNMAVETVKRPAKRRVMEDVQSSNDHAVTRSSQRRAKLAKLDVKMTRAVSARGEIVRQQDEKNKEKSKPVGIKGTKAEGTATRSKETRKRAETAPALALPVAVASSPARMDTPPNSPVFSEIDMDGDEENEARIPQENLEGRQPLEAVSIKKEFDEGLEDDNVDDEENSGERSPFRASPEVIYLSDGDDDGDQMTIHDQAPQIEMEFHERVEEPEIIDVDDLQMSVDGADEGEDGRESRQYRAEQELLDEFEFRHPKEDGENTEEGGEAERENIEFAVPDALEEELFFNHQVKDTSAPQRQEDPMENKELKKMLEAMCGNIFHVLNCFNQSRAIQDAKNACMAESVDAIKEKFGELKRTQKDVAYIAKSVEALCQTMNSIARKGGFPSHPRLWTCGRRYRMEGRETPSSDDDQEDGHIASSSRVRPSKRTLRKKSFKSKEIMDIAAWKHIPKRQFNKYRRGGSCPYCGVKGEHRTDSCPTVRTVEERRKMAEERSLCQRCLRLECPGECARANCHFCSRAIEHGMEKIIDKHPHHVSLCDLPERRQAVMEALLARQHSS